MKIYNIFRSYLYIYPLSWLLIFLHSVFVFFLYPPFNIFDLDKTFSLFWGLLTIIVQLQLIKNLSFGRRKVSLVFTLLWVGIHALLYTFYYTQHTAIDFALLYENFHLIFYAESIDTILSNLSFILIMYSLMAIIILYFLELRYRMLSGVYEGGRKNRIIILFFFLLNIGVITIPKENSDLLVRFIKSIWYFNQKSSVEVSGKKYPYIHMNKLSARFKNIKKKPHVFLIFMESYSGLYTDKKAKNGKVITPYFNHLKDQGYYIKEFYGHSIQTAKAQFGILSGIYPSIYSKVFTTYGDLALHALPAILGEHGYETVFTKAYRSLDFDNTRSYAQKLGFAHIESLGSEKYIKKEDKPFIWGWGLQDDKYYHKFFQYIDTIYEQNRGKPIFSTLTTVSNHMMFDKIPEDQKYLYPHADTKYMNSMYLADSYLKTFFDELNRRAYLSDSIVIIMGDHSWPSGEHGYWHNETSFYNEFFQTPCLILWKGKIKAEISTFQASQIDIAPTILNMLHIRTKNHFIGKSVFQRKQEETVLTVQPYGGTYLTAKRDNLKYVKHLQTKKEYLFNLKKDPLESDNIIQNLNYVDTLQVLRKDMKKLVVNEQLIRENRIWPSKKKAHKREDCQKNFSLTVTQQYKPIRSIDANRSHAFKKQYNIDIIYFLNSNELIHAVLGKLNFYHDFSTEIKGTFEVKTAGEYDIYVASDDGFRLYIDDKKISEFTGGRPLQGKAYRVTLSMGKHSFFLEHYQGYGDMGLEMKYKPVSTHTYLFWGADSEEITFGDR